MRKILILALIVFLCMNVQTTYSKEPRYQRVVVPPAENIAVAFYTGGSMDVPLNNFSTMIKKTEGLGFRVKNVTDLSNMYELEGVDILILMTQDDYSDDSIYVITEFVKYGGDLVILPPTNISDNFRSLLSEFGMETIGNVKDNVSYYNNESQVLLNGNWNTKLIIFEDIDSLLVVNATALNYTGDIGILKEWSIDQSISINNETNISTVFVDRILWGNNSTMAEYQKGKYLFGENVSLCYVQEYWFGSRIIVFSSSLMFADEYIVAEEYDNMMLFENIMKWLGDQINYIGIDNMIVQPDIETFDINIYDSLTVYFNVIATNIENESGFDDAIILSGFESLGRFINVEPANLTNVSFDATQKIINCSYETKLYFGNLLNNTKGRAIYIKILVIKQYYGFTWSKGIEVYIIKPPYEPHAFHPILLTTMLIIGINLIAILILLPHFLGARRKAQQIEKEIKKT